MSRRAQCVVVVGLTILTGCRSMNRAYTGEPVFETVSVDLGQKQGKPLYRAAGFLEGRYVAVPKERVAALKIRLERDGRNEIWQHAALARELGIEQQVVLLWPAGVDDEHPGDGGNWARWENDVADAVRRTQSLGIRVQWNLWNEPDFPLFWRRSGAQWNETWRRAFRVVRELDPAAIITGPDWSGGGDVHSERNRRFLEFCKQHDCVPDYFAWHFPKDVVEEAGYMRRLLKELGIRVKGLMVPEYCLEENLYCGRTAWEIARIERAGIDYACRASWPAGPPPLGGTLADPAKGVPRGVWWAYKRYADITGVLVKTEPGAHIELVAGVDEAKGVALMLLGNKGRATSVSGGTFSGNAAGASNAVGLVNVRVSGLDRMPWLVRDRRARARVERLPDDNGAAVPVPPVVIESDLPVRNGCVEIAIEWENERDAFAVQLSRAGPPSHPPETRGLTLEERRCQSDNVERRLLPRRYRQDGILKACAANLEREKACL